MKKTITSQPRHAIVAAAIAGAFAMTALPAAAIPLPLNTGIDFDGSVHPVGGPNVFDALGWDFQTLGAASPGIPGSIKMTNTSGGAFTVFDPFKCPAPTDGGCGTLRDVDANSPLPILNFLTFTQGPPDIATAQQASFDLSSLSVLQDPNLGVLVLSGVGTLRFAGFDPTLADFTLTSQGRGDTSFSGSLRARGVVAVAVPEPAPMLLLGAGIVGLFTFGRRKQS